MVGLSRQLALVSQLLSFSFGQMKSKEFKEMGNNSKRQQREVVKA